MKQKGKVAIYVEEKETYKNAPFRIKMGKGYYLQGENEIERKEWENANPVPEFAEVCELCARSVLKFPAYDLENGSVL